MAENSKVNPKLTPEMIEKVYSKIPELREQHATVMLPKSYFEKLTNDEFACLWYMPNLTINVGKKTSAYINRRRRLLGLKVTDHAYIEKEQPPSTVKNLRN